MQSQPNRQEPLSYNGAHPPSVPESMTAGSTQSAIPYNNTQHLTHGQTTEPTEPGFGVFGHRNDMYRGDVTPGYEFNYMAGPWQAPVPQPLGHSGYIMPNVQYGNVGEGQTNYGSQYDFTANQFPDFAEPFPHLPWAFTAPNNRGAFPVWRLHNVWVSYAVQDELHVTIAFRRIRST